MYHLITNHERRKIRERKVYDAKLLYFIVICALIMAFYLPAGFAQGTELTVKPRDAEEVKKEIDLEREKQIQFHLNEYYSLSAAERVAYLNDYVTADVTAPKTLLSVQSDKDVERYFRKLLENAYIFTMDDNGYVYDRNGQVIDKLNLNASKPFEAQSANGDITIQSLNNNIHGYNTGAFVRQSTVKGYKGIRTTLILPKPSDINPLNGSTAYLYNGIDIIQVNGNNVSIPFAVEAGFQYSTQYQNYAASIRPLGQDPIHIPEGYTDVPPRYKNGTSTISNLLYDNVSSQFKYFVTGTNVNNVGQYIYFYYYKPLTSQNLQDMVVKRVAAIAKNSWTGTEIGELTVSYTGTEITKVSNGTTTDLTSSLLITHNYGGKIYGTADNVNSTGSVTKTPSSGNIASQTITLDSY